MQFIKLKKGLPLVTASVVVIFDKCELVFQVFHLYLTLRGGERIVRCCSCSNNWFSCFQRFSYVWELFLLLMGKLSHQTEIRPCVSASVQSRDLLLDSPCASVHVAGCFEVPFLKYQAVAVYDMKCQQA